MPEQRNPGTPVITIQQAGDANGALMLRVFLSTEGIVVADALINATGKTALATLLRNLEAQLACRWPGFGLIVV